MKQKAKKLFKNGDILIYARQAHEEANMSITVGEFTGVFLRGVVVGIEDDSIEFPLVGVLDISECFDVVKQN